ncbi:hypothetical protein WJX81_005360 [Elliptochloris bilobata]|uniref:Pyruvate kinase n=1 Tax=Elliptochloris bilobata TaxID=381761 RepID=A0AAW1R3N1_9CHLO
MPSSRRPNKVKTHVLKDCSLPSLLVPIDPNESDFTATKVIVTIGPACQDVDTLCKLLDAGATCARVDLTWGPLEFHKRSLVNLGEAMRRTRKLCAVMVDVVGREIILNRPSKIDEDGWPRFENPISVKATDKVTLTTGMVPEGAAGNVLPVSYEKFTSMVQPGDTVFLGRYLVTGSEDSSLYLTVDSVGEKDVVCTAMNAGVLDGLITVFHTERSTDSLANLQNDLPILCPEDKAALEALQDEFEVDFVSLSFARTADDIVQAREFLDSAGLTTTKIIAKCETRQSLFNFKSIAGAADGIILSRGNLGLDVLPEKMALVQKSVISNCNLIGKPIIITRVVDTMCVAPRPTRAEATDVANVVLDGADGILLGAETLRGKYPVLTVETIMKICRQAEKVFDHVHHFDHLMQEAMEIADDTGALGGSGEFAQYFARNVSQANLTPAMPSSLGNGVDDSDGQSLRSINRHDSQAQLTRAANLGSPLLSKLESIASSAVRAADKVGASLIIVYTRSGQTASLVSKYRPPQPIMTLVVPQLKNDGFKWHLEGRDTARRCLIQRGLLPVLAAPSQNSGESLLEEAVAMASRAGLVHAKDHIVVVQMLAGAFVVKIVSVDEGGYGIQAIRPKSLVDLMMATAGASKEEELGQDNGNGEGRVGHTIGQPGLQPRELTHVSSMKHNETVRPAMQAACK